jgi:nickel transport protein
MKRRWLFSGYGVMLLVVLMFPRQVLAHGVEGDVQPGGLTVGCRYNTGEALSYAKVTVKSPATPQTFQVGNTDRNGRFCFFPDALGEWRVTAEDGMGHRLEVKIPVTDLNSLKTIPPSAQGGRVSDTMTLRVLTGLSVILGLSGLLFWWQGLRIQRGRKEP